MAEVRRQKAEISGYVDLRYVILRNADTLIFKPASGCV